MNTCRLQSGSCPTRRTGPRWASSVARGWGRWPTRSRARTPSATPTFHISPRAQVTFPVRVFKLLGVETLIVTNAAGSLANSYKTGDIMIIKDHINVPGLAGLNPLIGPNDEKFGPRFPPMSGAYDKALRRMALDICKSRGYSQFVQEGVYCMVGGPNFETIAEARLLHKLGADAVGMSTAPEVVSASHCGLKVLGLSLITNRVTKDYEDTESVDHGKVLGVSKMRSETLQGLVSELVAQLDINGTTAE
nr:PREDICTED: purine nucleoside phosphorylase-like isoform X2 [Lepisosteus oculatus]